MRGFVNASFTGGDGTYLRTARFQNTTIPRLAMNWADIGLRDTAPPRLNILTRFRNMTVGRIGRIGPYFTALRRRIAPTRAYRGADLGQLMEQEIDLDLQDTSRSNILSGFRNVETGRIGRLRGVEVFKKSINERL